MIQIKASQDAKLADYAEDCIADVASCLSQNSYNNYPANAYAVVSQSSNYSDVAIRACMSQINTCRSVTQRKKDIDNDVYSWLDQAIGTTYACTQKGGTYDYTTNTCKITKGQLDANLDIKTGELMDPTGTAITGEKCSKLGGTMVGTACKYTGADVDVSIANSPRTLCQDKGGTYGASNNKCVIEGYDFVYKDGNFICNDALLGLTTGDCKARCEQLTSVTTWNAATSTCSLKQ